MEVRREAPPGSQAMNGGDGRNGLRSAAVALVIAASPNRPRTHRHRQTGGTRGGDALLRPATRARASNGESAAVDATGKSQGVLPRAARHRARWRQRAGRGNGVSGDAAGAARPAAQRDTVSKALGDVSYSKAGTAPPSISAAPSYNPTYQPSPAPSVTPSPTDLPTADDAAHGRADGSPSGQPTPLPSYAPTTARPWTNRRRRPRTSRRSRRNRRRRFSRPTSPRRRCRARRRRTSRRR